MTARERPASSRRPLLRSLALTAQTVREHVTDDPVLLALQVSRRLPPALAGGAALRHVHLQDVDGFADRHWHPGEGNIPWKSVFAALNRLPQMPRLLLEVADPRALRQGADHLIGLGLAQ